MNSLKKNKIDAFCGWGKSQKDLCESSSGGIFFILAKKIIENGGYVSGAVYSTDFRSVNHIVSRDIDDVKRMRGSKYSQSNYNEIINKIREICAQGKVVLFSGTPCQCYVIKNKIKSNFLICIDLICNGLQDHRILESEIDRMESKANAKIASYSMRYKKNCNHLPLYMQASFKNGDLIEVPFYQSVLGKIYGSRLALQKSCYRCKFKGLKREGDITLGDYRGVKSLKSIKINPSGSSTIIINTKKGNELINSICDEIELFRAKNILEVIWSNNRIVISGCRPSKKNIAKFWKVYAEQGVESASFLSGKYLSRISNLVLRIIDRLLLIKYILVNVLF